MSMTQGQVPGTTGQEHDTRTTRFFFVDNSLILISLLSENKNKGRSNYAYVVVKIQYVFLLA